MVGKVEAARECNDICASFRSCLSSSILGWMRAGVHMRVCERVGTREGGSVCVTDSMYERQRERGERERETTERLNL